MKLSDNTIEVLKNFAKIENSLLIQPGKVQKTLSDDSSVMASVELDEEFPIEFGVYDLSSFLANIGYVKNAEVEFNDAFAEIKGDGTTIKFYGADKRILKYPKKPDPVVEYAATFEISHETMKKAVGLASLNGLEHISILGKGGKITIKAHNRETKDSNFGSIQVGDYQGQDFSVDLKGSNLNMLPMNYEVGVCLDGFVRFVGQNGRVKYFVGILADE